MAITGSLYDVDEERQGGQFGFDSIQDQIKLDEDVDFDMQRDPGSLA